MQGCPRVPSFLSCSKQKLCQGDPQAILLNIQCTHCWYSTSKFSGGSSSHNWFNPHQCNDVADDDDTNVLVMSCSLRSWHTGDTTNRLLYAKPKSLWNLRAGLPLYYLYCVDGCTKLTVREALKRQDPQIWTSSELNVLIIHQFCWSHKSWFWMRTYPTQDFPSAYSSYLYIFYSSTHGRDQVGPSIENLSIVKGEL